MCACGCGRLTGGTWYPGDDAVHKSHLLQRLDAGDADAGTELVNRGWYREEVLADREAKRVDRQDAKYRRQVQAEQRRAAKEAAKVKRAETEAD